VSYRVCANYDATIKLEQQKAQTKLPLCLHTVNICGFRGYETTGKMYKWYYIMHAKTVIALMK
jgi:hypothetical protein